MPFKSIQKRTVFAALIGNTLEYYDYTLFAVFSSEIAELFFPNYQPHLRLMLTLSVFASGFFMRPLGAVIFGHIGDKYGRKQALTISIACMALPTLGIGLIPDHSCLGALAPVLLLILRMIQGISIGGEGAGSAVFILEHSKGVHVGYLGGVIVASNFVGVLLATFSGIIMNNYSVNLNGWRVAFILGGMVGIVGIFLRRKTEETPAFKVLNKNNKIENLPLLKALKTHRPEMILSVFLGSLVGAFANVILAYTNVFLKNVLSLDGNLSTIYTSLQIFAFIIALPILGFLSDRIGHQRFLISGSVLSIILLCPVYTMIANQESYIQILALIIFAIFSAWICAPSYPIVLKLFAPELRYSGIAFSYNIGIAFFGGTAPLICTWLTSKINQPYAAAIYLNVLALVYILTDFLIKKTKSLSTERVA